MIQGRSVVAIIPARGGSKGLPGKNLRTVGGRPLIAWTIDKALKSKYLDLVLVSTDSEEIAAAARRIGADVPFIRPAELATDTAVVYDVIRHALTFVRDRDRREFDYTVLLEPTSPLREDDDVDRMLDALVARESDFDAIVSVGEIREHPSIVKRFVDCRIEPFCPELVLTPRRQDYESAYFPFGVAYIAKTPKLLGANTFYLPRCLGHVIKRYQNYEIDDAYDCLCVEAVMKHEWNLP
jgi:CMP-N-acetylneuraminic acid synthetase